MGWWIRWLFGDLVGVVSPRVDRGPVPTRRAARRLLIAGVIVSFVGAVAVSTGTSALENQPATVVGRYTVYHGAGAAGGRIHEVTLRFADGDRKSIPDQPLYDAVGDRTAVPVRVDVDPDTKLVDAIYLDGVRYGTGRRTARVVIAILFAAFGGFLLLRGIGRARRARLVAT